FVDVVRLERDGVEDAVHPRNSAGLGHEGRVYALLDAVGRALGEPQKLDFVPEVGRNLDVDLGDAADSFDEDLVRGYLAAEAEARQDRELVGGVVAVDV